MNDSPESPAPRAPGAGPEDHTELLDAPTTASEPKQPTPTEGTGTGRLLRALAVMGSGTMVSRLLGFVRVILAAFVIGNGTQQADAYALPLTISTALYMVFAGGALNSVLVPQLTRAARNDADGGEAYTNRITTAFLTIGLAVTVLSTLAAPLILRLYVAKEWRTPEMADHYNAMLLMTTVVMPEVFFFGAYMVFGQILNSRDRFGPMMWAPVASNVLQIASFVVFLGVWGKSTGRDPFTTGQVWLLGGAHLLGAILQAVVLFHFLHRAGYRYRPRFDLKGAGLGKTFRLAGWAFGFVLINQVALSVVSQLATSATASGEEGAGLNVYNNAYLLFMLPHSLVTVSLATAMVTSASRLAHAGDLAGTAAEVMRTMRLVATALVPAAFLLVALGGPLAQLMFGNGRSDAHYVGWTIMAFGVGLIPFTIQSVCLRTYYVLERNRDTFFLQLLIAGTQVAASLLLVKALPFAAPGTVAPLLAIAVAVAYIVGLIVSFQHLNSYLPDLSGAELTRHLVRVSVAIAPGAVLAWLIADRLSTSQPMRLVALALAGLVAFGSFLLLARMFQITEITAILRRFRPGRGRSRDSSDDEDTLGTGAGEDSLSDETPTRTHPYIAPSFEGPGVVAPMDPDAPTFAFSTEQMTEVRAMIDSDSEDTLGGAEESEESVAADGPSEAEPDTAEEAHPVQVRAGQLLGGRYKLEEMLVRRAETQTWRAQDRMLSRSVIIHLLPPGRDYEELLAAARRAAIATDSRFLRVLDASAGESPIRLEGDEEWWDGERDEEVGPYIVCEYAPGQSLERFLAQGPLSALEAAWIVREVADGLSGMHEQGLYHERISPDTVVITDTGNVKIVGFLLESELGPSRDHPIVAGSDPEAVDVADLGRLLYCTLVSRWPGGPAYGMGAAPTDSEGRLLTPRQVRAGVSPALDSICDRILSPLPRQREEPLRSAVTVARALSRILGTANAAQDLERRMRFPVPIVDLGEEATPSTQADQPRIDTAAGLPLAPIGDPDAPTGRIPPVPAAADMPTGPLDAVGGATPTEPEVRQETVYSSEEEDEDEPEITGRDRRHPIIPTLIVLTLLALVAGLIAVGFRLAPRRTAASDEPSGAPPRSTDRWPVRAATDFDPQGDTRQENPDQVGRAWDGNPSTAWTTLNYARADMAGKQGVGLIVDLGEVREVTRADLTLVGEPTSVQLRVPAATPETVTAPPTERVDQWQRVGGANRAPAQVTITTDSTVRTRFVLVLLTEIPATGSDFRGGIAEVVFWG